MRKSTILSAVIFAASTFALPASSQYVNVSVSPELGQIPGPINEVVLTFDGVESLEFSERALLYYDPSETVDKEGIIYFGGYEISQSPDMYSASISGNQVVFTPKSSWDLEGKYELMVPQGAIIMTIDGKKQEWRGCNYVWYISDSVNPTVTPGAGDVSDIYEVTVSVPEGYEFNGGYILAQLPRIYRRNAFGEMTGAALAVYNVPEGTTLDSFKGVRSFTFVKPMNVYPKSDFKPEEGADYMFVIPTSSLRVKNLESGKERLTLEICVPWHYTSNNSSVSVPVADESETVTVYTPTGIRICSEEPRSILNSLPQGLYIINGRKIVLR